MVTARPTNAASAERILRPNEQELLEAWMIIHEANAEQEARLDEQRSQSDRMAPTGSYLAPNLDTITRRDIRNPPSDVQILEAFIEPNDWWFDIGCSGGRHTLFLSKRIDRVTAIDPSPGMRRLLAENVVAEGAENVDILDISWPPEASIGEPDVCLTVDVTYFTPLIGSYLDAMEQHARRLCIVGSTELGTAARPVEPVFEELHGEPFVRLPGLHELLAILGARRRRFEVRTLSDPLVVAPVAARIAQGETLDAAHERVRSHYLVREGSEKDAQLRDLLERHFGVGEGRVQMPMPAGDYRAVVSWPPPDAIA